MMAYKDGGRNDVVNLFNASFADFKSILCTATSSHPWSDLLV